MRKKYVLLNIAAIAAIVGGILLRGFFGGCLFGAAIILLLLVYIGKPAATKAAQLMDKRMRDAVEMNNEQ